MVGVCEKVHEPASPVLNPLPVAETIVPFGPLVGVSTMKGPVTIIFAEAESPVPPVTVRVYVPGVAVVAIVNPLPVN